MAGPRSLSRSTKVAAPAASGKNAKGKGKQKYGKSKKKAPLATWDHDNSSGDESVDADAEPAAATAAAAAAGKKRPRAEALDRDGEDVPARDDQEADARKSERERAGEEEESSGGEDEEADGGGEGEGGEEEDGGGAAATPAGGMGDVMARILGQKLDSRVQAPVLAKRKTKAMKEMENASAKRAETRGRSAVRRANMTQQFVIPDHTTTDYERQLKKIATRGVVALFNAISKRQTQADDSVVSKVTGTAKAAAVKGASRHAFLDMLKTGVKPTGDAAGAPTAGAAGGEKRARGEGQGGAEANAGGEGEAGGKSWSVLKEDYMMGASSMKNWDQESADSEEDALAGPDDMSDDDSD